MITTTATTTPVWRRWRAPALLGTVALLAAVGTACGGSSSKSSTTASTTPSVCSQRQAVKQSLQDLTNVDVVKNGTSALNSAVTDVKTNLDGLAQSASTELKPEVQAVQTSVQQLQTAVTNLGSGGVTPVVNALSSLKTSASTLGKDLDNLKC